MHQCSKLLAGVCFLLGVGAAANAQDRNVVEAPCSAPVYRQFDFWIGDWQVFKSGTEKLAGVDQIESILDGCALDQDWLQLDDSFRPEGGDSRLKGRSLLSVTQDGKWRQTWVDNSGYMNTLTGGREENGDMVLRSGPVRYPSSNGGYANVYFEWRWTPNADGTVRSWGRTKVGEDGEWNISFDNIYRPNK